MLKRNEGYALSYVLVVLLVLCAIAITVMSVSLNNLKNQQAAIDRMTEKYAAQGLVEQIVAQLENGSDFNTVKSNLSSSGVLTANGNSENNFSFENEIYSVTMKAGNYTVSTDFRLTNNKAEYISYDVTYTPPEEGGGE